MGKRKAAKKPVAKKAREGLATSFKCVFCNNETSVTTKIDKKSSLASLSCRDCGQTYQTSKVTSLTQPVDVYYDWIDACDEVAKGEAATTPYAPPPSALSRPGGARRGEDDSAEKYTDEDGDGFIEDDEIDGQADYADDD
ncbi:Hypothetical protein R9X50_00355600 [Acrodontium crateriforme]|uniref:Transcription elongation factor 1 homolog n=1 Tax=Acrodontium crateriforme TaxID=150365 RepID=A0AAQ3R4B6_9PEZI|nr:Hypothetical protein R9X50_00355600 [Acrodontium crateriforme]